MTSRHVLAPRRYLAAAAAVLLAATFGGSSAAGAAQPNGAIKPAVAQERGAAALLPPILQHAKGDVTVSLTLSEKPLAATVGKDALRLGTLPSRAVQQGRTAAVLRQQAEVAGEAGALGAHRLGAASRAVNVIALRVPAAKLTQLSRIPGVLAIKPVARYHMMADPAGPPGDIGLAGSYLGIDKVRAAGYDGTGVRVALLDSGVDFTHKDLGGPGTVAAYAECYTGASGTANAAAPTGACAALFGPGAPKVKGGYDFVGDIWDGSDGAVLAKDPNPIDFEGHGTHTADIAAGRSADGSHTGMAPGADVYSVKVCSSVATACSGVAIIQGIDWALDPNGDGDISDAMDVVNMSLGSDYGQPEDDSYAAVQAAVNAGVTFSVSAGNGSDRPFKVGSPSTAPGAISVAETAVPDDKLYPIQIVSPTISALPGNTIRNADLQPWSPAPTAAVQAPLAVPTGDKQGCTAAAFTGFPAGAIALVQRGTCNGSQKPANAQAAGAVATIIYNNVPGDPPGLSYGGGGPITIPTLTVSLDKGTVLAAAIAAGPVTAKIDPASAIPLKRSVVGTSSRGPRDDDEAVKPDIGAPGGWITAEVGTGSEETPFGGTSGAAPVIAGVAALILQAHPAAGPAEVKTRLLNGADSLTRGMDPEANFSPAPVTRVGAGEVRAAGAVLSRDLLTNDQAGAGNLSFGLPHLSTATTFSTGVVIRNNGGSSVLYHLSSRLRDSADGNHGVTFVVPNWVRVAAHAGLRVPVQVRVDPAKLPAWPFTGRASQTGDGSALNAPEVDGTLLASGGGQNLHLGWQILPHRSADLAVPASLTLNSAGAGTLTVTNRSKVQASASHVYALLGTSPKLPAPAPGKPGSVGSNQVQVDLAAAGVRDDATTLSFAIAGWKRFTVPMQPAGYEVDLDTTGDGLADYAIYHDEFGGPGTSGTDVTEVYNIATKETKTESSTVSDFDSSTLVMSVPLADLGLRAGTTFVFRLFAYDDAYSDKETEHLDGAWTVGRPGLTAAGTLAAGPGKSAGLPVKVNPSAGPSTQTGLLLLNDDAAGQDFSVVTVKG